MAVAGAAFILRTEDEGSPGTYLSLGGAVANNYSVDNTPIVISDKSSVWQQLLAIPANKVCQMEVSGIYDGTGVAMDDIKTWMLSLNDCLVNVQMADGDGLRLVGSMFVSNVAVTGDREDSVKYSMSLSSNGAITEEADV